MKQLRSALDALVSPLGIGAGWPETVNARLRTLLDCDVIIFRLSNRQPAWVDPASDADGPRTTYRREFRELDPWARHLTRPGDALLQTPDSLGRFGLDDRAYREEFLIPNRIGNYIGVQIGTVPGHHLHIGAFDFARASSDERRHRRARLFGVVLPAVRTGLRVWRTAGAAGDGLASVLDALEDAVALYSQSGGRLHLNRALLRRLESDPQRLRVEEALDAFARDAVRGRRTGRRDGLAAGEQRTVRTAGGCYRIYGVAADGVPGAERGVLLVVDAESAGRPGPCSRRDSPTVAPDDFGLTPREAEVAELLAAGCSNAAVARALSISPNTAQSHTRRVLAKLGLRSRSGVHGVLYPSG